MTAHEAIETAVQRLVAAANPRKVILFGSYAEGKATSESDLDLLVIEREVASKRKEMVRLRKAIGSVGLPVDVLVYSEEEVADWGHLPGTALYWALKDGKVLYEAA
ncbi:MAG: nucleotidyltransferase domain-containing protein [Nitrospirae bacterium]|nr:MAG: nucleotidyltransferase domain-containing protein [Nitrospirota bacterium]